jgi:hypothetical protein
MNKTMKTIRLSKYILVALIFIGPVYSCSDYLDVKPVSQFGPDFVFSNVDNAKKALYGVYGCLGGDQAYGIRISMYYPYDNDEMMGQGGAPGDNERRDIARYNVQPGNTQLAGPFNQLYKGIERANICIYYIPKMEMYAGGTATEQRELKRLYGEALTLRAQFYYELVRNWGDVPAQFVPSSFATDLFIGKTDREVIYDKILADLEEASVLVPWLSEVGAEERVTQGAVRGLRARIALAKGGYSLRENRLMERPANYKDYYQIARDECKVIIDKNDHQLNPDFLDIFKNNLSAGKIDKTGEVVWEVGMTGGNTANGDSKLGYYNGPTLNGKGNAALAILPTTFYAFHENDKRRDVTCAPYSKNGDGTTAGRRLNQIPDGKFRREWTSDDGQASNGQYFSINWPLLRYSDVLLMYAEAENELNGSPTADAIVQFEKVRIRAFGGNASLIGTTPADYTGFFKAIMKERMLELCGEGVRKFDLIRWNLLGQRLAEVKLELAALAAGTAPYDNLPTVMYYDPTATTITWLNSFYAPEGAQPPGSASVNWRNEVDINGTITDVMALNFEAGKSELLPFHTTTIDANPKIGQNKGY